MSSHVSIDLLEEGEEVLAPSVASSREDREALETILDKAESSAVSMAALRASTHPDTSSTLPHSLA